MRVPKIATHTYAINVKPIADESRFIRQPQQVDVQVDFELGKPVSTAFAFEGHEVCGGLPSLKKLLQILTEVVDLVDGLHNDHEKRLEGERTRPTQPPTITRDGEL